MKIVITTNDRETMFLEDFLMWEMNGGRGTYESDLKEGEPCWDELSLDEQFVYMANSICGDMITDNWHLEIKEVL